MHLSTQQELRAYLSVEPLGLAALDNFVETLGHVAVRNVGKLPAKDVSVTVKLTTVPGKNFSPPFIEDKKKINRAIQPGSSIRQGSVERLPTEYMHPDQRGYIYIYGIAHYGDGFGERRYTQFCHRYDPTSYDHRWARRDDNEDRMIIRPEKARYHTDGNGAT